MERKIGEIFEYNGEWYQCVGGTCRNCSFYYDTVCKNITTIGSTNLGNCHCSLRTDHKSVIFKKLEKVGEPYVKRVSDGTFSTFQRYKVYNSVILPKEPYIYCNFIDGTIEIEIKQNKEDMEEKNNGNTPLNVLTDKYVNGDICYDDFEKEVKALYSCKEEIKPNLKEFDLEAAKAGKPVCTRDGHKARIICFDKHGGLPIVSLVETKVNGRAYCVDTIKVEWRE